MMKLVKLCQGIIEIREQHQQIEINGLAQDSRQVKEGYLFFAVPGLHTDGMDYIPQAIEKGASAIFCEESSNVFTQADIITHSGKEIPIYTVPHLSLHIGAIASVFFGEPSHKFDLLGITGTNGKSSCVYFIAQALTYLQKKCAMLGTIGNGFVDELRPSLYTTADAIALQASFAQFAIEGVQAVAMEVSSHGLAQGRVNGSAFDIAAFTNLTQDHLDYHGDMHTYGLAKRKLFLMPGLRYAIFNVDDAFGMQLYQELKETLYCYAITTQTDTHHIPAEHLLQANKITQNQKGLSFIVSSPWGQAAIDTGLLGNFNVSNLLIVFACLAIMQVPFASIVEVLQTLKPVPGRMQVMQTELKPKVVIDYAHTPDALEKALTALSDHRFGKLWCVFGCGGDRDKTKRPLMGAIAERYADRIIITSDNPRSEQAEQIANDIVRGMTKDKMIDINLDRRAAIESALQQATANDVILIAGKGHETYQEIQGVRYPFSDQIIVEQFWATQELCND